MNKLVTIIGLLFCSSCLADNKVSIFHSYGSPYLETLEIRLNQGKISVDEQVLSLKDLGSKIGINSNKWRFTVLAEDFDLLPEVIIELNKARARYEVELIGKKSVLIKSGPKLDGASSIVVTAQGVSLDGKKVEFSDLYKKIAKSKSRVYALTINAECLLRVEMIEQLIPVINLLNTQKYSGRRKYLYSAEISGK